MIMAEPASEEVVPSKVQQQQKTSNVELGDQLLVFTRSRPAPRVNLRLNWAGKRGERCPRRRQYACDRRIANDGRRSDGVIRACPPSHRPKTPYFDSARIRFDDGPSSDSPLTPGLALPWRRVVRRPLAPREP